MSISLLLYHLLSYSKIISFSLFIYGAGILFLRPELLVILTLGSPLCPKEPLIPQRRVLIYLAFSCVGTLQLEEAAIRFLVS